MWTAPSAAATTRCTARTRSDRPLFPLVLYGALEVDLAFLGLTHEPLQLLLELRVSASLTLHPGSRVLESLDREVDLPVFLDGHDLGLDLVVLAEVFANVADIVPVDLGDVNQADLAVLELEERTIGRDALDGRLDDRPDLYICDRDPFPCRAVEMALSHQPTDPSTDRRRPGSIRRGMGVEARRTYGAWLAQISSPPIW